MTPDLHDLIKLWHEFQKEENIQKEAHKAIIMQTEIQRQSAFRKRVLLDRIGEILNKEVLDEPE